MVPVCLYFEAHQPWRLRRYDYFDAGHDHRYFDDEGNRSLLAKAAARCYRPVAALFSRLLSRHPSFAASFSFSGCVIEQLRETAPDVLDAFGELGTTGRVEFLAETSHHSLAWLALRREFEEQVAIHREMVRKTFGVAPRVFRNTELIYSDEVAQAAEDLGFSAVLADGIEPLLHGRSPRHVYRAATARGLPLLLRDYRLSDDVAFRFSDRSWVEHPLTADRYDRWVAGADGELVCLFMDLETLGEHQRAETGIFEFFEAWVERHLARDGGRFLTPSQAVETLPARDRLPSPGLVSWADEARDVSAWQGNELQRDALRRLFALEGAVRTSGAADLLRDFRRLTTSDHFYYMATKTEADGGVHAYFSPWETPYDAYMAFRHVLADMEIRLGRGRTPLPRIRELSA